MKLTWLTDIHLDSVTPTTALKFIYNVAEHRSDGVLLTGDIGQADSLFGLLEQMSKVWSRSIYFVLGNHDYYRGSIASVRDTLSKLTMVNPLLHYLTNLDYISLTPHTALIGHDGWGDAREGNYTTTQVLLNDFKLIAELKDLPQEVLNQNLNALGDQAKTHLRKVLATALLAHEKIIILTHVPPFPQAAWHQGKSSEPNWLPYFCCQASGTAILEAARKYPDKKITVLCGHTHGTGEYSPLPNVKVYTGGATYGAPAIQRFVYPE